MNRVKRGKVYGYPIGKGNRMYNRRIFDIQPDGEPRLYAGEIRQRYKGTVIIDFAAWPVYCDLAPHEEEKGPMYWAMAQGKLAYLPLVVIE